MVENIIAVLENPRDPNKKPFDFIKMKKEVMQKIRKQNQQEIIQDSKNCIRYENSKEVIPVSADNINDIEMHKVDAVTCLDKSGNKLEVELKNLNPKGAGYKERLEFLLYRELVRANVEFDMPQALKIKQELTEKFGIAAKKRI